ncbi:MAG: hypothetical protein LN413_05645 [Candidatus Thermoplasmatota archaeon]|nr:hypothetical protein [Candidatus Thermoplasmatota archaeon]
MRGARNLAPGGRERRVEVDCPVCVGDWKRCRFATCPKLRGVREWTREAQRRQGTSLYGATPPAAFVGQWGYPRVLVGPLLPPTDVDVSLMDAEERWLGLPLQEILRLRMSMVRGKRPQRVGVAAPDDRPLEALQEVAMASDPVYAEMELTKRPNLNIYFSPRGKPMGPSAPFESFELAENPAVPRRVDYIVSDGDLRAGPGTWDLYEHGIGQRHLTRLLSVGLLGQTRHRRLVPTEWSITAIDDIVGKHLRDRVRYHPELGEVHLYGAGAVANNVQILLLPGPWMFEALEGWEGHPAGPASDFERAWGRKDYPTNLVGAYHASRLPVLEHLDTIRRQAIALVFLEVYREWIPLGVWRFREVAREAFRRRGRRFSSLDEALEVLRGRLRIPLDRWLQKSTLYSFYQNQRRLEDFVEPSSARSHY